MRIAPGIVVACAALAACGGSGATSNATNTSPPDTGFVIAGNPEYVALLGAYPTDFRAASHTGGGVRPAFIVAGPAPTIAEAQTIRTPYQMHHGDADVTVVRTSPLMFQRVHDWYHAHGIL